MDFTYNAVNQIETLTRWRDLTATNKVGSTTFAYDALNRVENLQHRGNTGTLLSNYTYTFEDGGRLTTEVLGSKKGVGTRRSCRSSNSTPMAARRW